ncbi:hypothetical protein [Blastococcus brunescens]|uniref:Uncharacterized protein n=1 Tax=Blastococcus brunescens TaxID=1564165 RepID=A0ABZ1AYD9_9ACTN|nr:hypothetical protein [Blastococcus sp. BMG 8361]WRL62946.1 hypothetical protein U6N30_24265 [Blastococcus sp. BMG 8361]
MTGTGDAAQVVAAAPAQLVAPELGGRAMRTAPGLEPVADSSLGTLPLVAAAGALLALTTLLVVRRLRARSPRAR